MYRNVRKRISLTFVLSLLLSICSISFSNVALAEENTNYEEIAEKVVPYQDDFSFDSNNDTGYFNITNAVNSGANTNDGSLQALNAFNSMSDSEKSSVLSIISKKESTERGWPSIIWRAVKKWGPKFVKWMVKELGTNAFINWVQEQFNKITGHK